MKRILLRVIAVLTVLHGAATFVASTLLPLSVIGDRRLFAQHGFAFIFLALLNLVIWQVPSRGALSRICLHACNAAFAIFNLALALHHPEPPTWTAAVLVSALALLGAVQEWSLRNAK